MVINYGFAPSPFGKEVLICTTSDCIFALDFVMDNRRSKISSQEEAFERCKEIFKKKLKRYDTFTICRNDHLMERIAKQIFECEESQDSQEMQLLLVGSPFQLKVWKAISQIPLGSTVSYSQLAKMSGYPKAVRAVATAVGQNPISFIIPCHRVIRKSGSLGQYDWGTEMKRQILDWEKKNLQ